MNGREQFLFDKVVQQLQYTTQHMPLSMDQKDAFMTSKSGVKKDLLLMIDMLDRVDYDWFKPFMKNFLTPPANRQ